MNDLGDSAAHVDDDSHVAALDAHRSVYGRCLSQRGPSRVINSSAAKLLVGTMPQPAIGMNPPSPVAVVVLIQELPRGPSCLRCRARSRSKCSFTVLNP